MDISGDWYSRLGSRMHLETDPSGGVSGTYVSGTGHAVGPYPLVGRWDPLSSASQGTVLGWTVTWRNDRGDANSVTSWSGQYYDDRGADGERICASWLLTTSAESVDAWRSTTVGQDVFTRDAGRARASG
ncbi:avidin/streptavidin family protein [Streptacidiphilus sp. ASG 303]|uniref:avidin/streptavidin family protein n=1 Tax=Streptacidiphilus sp. ASG 303 TaxID=2896847 RepID=UPI001E4AD3D2|nr:avidin/streptavidin family protein [Streptacidiphilus sp. ASG 303]MCD0486008.1 avidin/streptavidin family protein [Streptacidiphilus sp. ASG 303]